jgi:hypothetical protein
MVKRVLLSLLLTLVGVSLTQAETLPRSQSVTVPAGTLFHCRVQQTLTTRLNFQGDAFTANISEPVMMDGHEVIPVGATVEGRIALLERPGRVRGVAEMRLVVEAITFPDGRSFPLSALLMTAYGADDVRVVDGEGTVKGPSSRRETAEEIGGGSAVGSLVGLLFGQPWIGVAVGGTAGFVDRVRRGGKDLHIPAGTQLNYQLIRPLQLYRDEHQYSAPRGSPSAGN